MKSRFISNDEGCDQAAADIEYTALQEALAEQAEQEPVGYWDGKFSKGGASALYEVPQESAFGYHYENYPLYAAPVRTKDLTPHEITALIREGAADGGWQGFAQRVIAADRAKNGIDK